MGRILAALLMLVCAVPAANAQYPDKPIRILVAFAPGGAVDITARILAQKLTDAFGQQVVVENRPGGGGTIAVNTVAKAAPDGYTLLVAANAEIAANPVLFPDSATDPVKDLSPISLLTMTPFLIVAKKDSTINSFEDLFKQAKERPGKISWSSAGNGSTNHFAGAWLAAAAGIQLLHVPYKGAAPAAAAIAGGEVEIGVVSPASALSFIKADKVKVLGLTTKDKPDFYKQWPSAAEKGLKEYDAAAWMGLFAPAGTPKAILDKLNAESNKMLKAEDVQKRLADLGFVPVGTTAPEFVARVQDDLKLYKRIAQEAGIRASQ